MKKIQDYLKLLDFSNTESEILLKLYESGPMTVAEIAKEIKLNRTAVYPYLHSLLEKGIIGELMMESRKKFAAADPERLQYIIQKKQDSLKLVQSKLPNVLDMLNAISPKNLKRRRAEIKYYIGENTAKAIYNDAFKSNEFRSFVRLEPNVFDDDIRAFNEAFQRNKKLKIREIVYDSKEKINISIAVDKNSRYAFKLMPDTVRLTDGDILIYDGKVAIVNYSGQIDALILRSSVYYNNFKELFDFMWRTLPNVT